MSYDKKSPINGMLKLALNAAGFGDTNNTYSPFYDPQMTMATTIGGQLSLLMLVEILSKIDSLEVIQANTDGITARLKRTDVDEYYRLCGEWEKTTNLVLEYEDYSRMWIRDVNNYIAEYDSKYEDEEPTKRLVKTKGAYNYKDLDWNKNFSSLIIQKAVSAVLIDGKDLTDFITNHDDIFDFQIMMKVNRKTKLLAFNELYSDQSINEEYYKKFNIAERYQLQHLNIDNAMYEINMTFDIEKSNSKDIAEKLNIKKRLVDFIIENNDDFPNGFPDTVEVEEKQRISRGYIANDGYTVYKRMNPINSSPWDRYIGINADWKIAFTNNIHDFDRSNLNYDYYIQEANKLIQPVLANRRIRAKVRNYLTSS